MRIGTGGAISTISTKKEPVLSRGGALDEACGTMSAPVTLTPAQLSTIAVRQSKGRAGGAPGLTHLHLEERSLGAVEGLAALVALRVLYLYENALCSLSALGLGGPLTHLYVSKNEVATLRGLEQCASLQKIYADENAVRHVDGLEMLRGVEELHLSRQAAPAEGAAGPPVDGSQVLELGGGFSVCPHTIVALSASLRVLGLAGNGITRPSCLRVLSRCEQLDLADNAIEDMEELQIMIAGMESMTTLKVARNPLCSRRKYAESLIVASVSITTIDELVVNQQQRHFLVQMEGARRRKAGGA